MRTSQRRSLLTAALDAARKHLAQEEKEQQREQDAWIGALGCAISRSAGSTALGIALVPVDLPAGRHVVRLRVEGATVG